MFYGSIVALVTPMQPNGQVDKAAFAELIEWHIQEGTQAIVIAGSTGEAATLTQQEKHDLVRQAVELVRGRIPVIAGSAANGTDQTILLTRSAMEAGADACLIMTPAYIKPTQEGLYQHYKHIAEAVAIPQILYNVPGRTACDLLPETIARLARLPNIVAVKEASGDPKRTQTILELSAHQITVLSGNDCDTFAIMQSGGRGVISVVANILPKLSQELCQAMLAGKLKQAKEIDALLLPLYSALFIETNPIPVKWAMHQMGLIQSGIRLPLTVLSKPHEGSVRQAMQAAGLLHANAV
ncbi:MAG: 4-hydroxy-tetrahydrodipicolinate synthase [Gammaproteobacteria bacterium]|jgi:4-hydroxy-tetrahydrodipicolinate synthase|nr:4-hydroxy-tetrahydrodipicolinate synthase [Gammaproteobacteria bacterium]